jgi:hypothetical protein
MHISEPKNHPIQVSDFTLKLFFETRFASTNILRVTLKMRAETHISLHVKCPLFLSDFNWNALKHFDETLHIKFQENPISGSTVITCGQADMPKPTGAYRISPHYEFCGS